MKRKFEIIAGILEMLEAIDSLETLLKISGLVQHFFVQQ